MPRFNITAEFDLSTTIECDGGSGEVENCLDGLEGVKDVDVSMPYSGENVTVSGGEITFTVDAEDADAAESEVTNALEGNEITDYNNLTWIIENVSVSVEADEMSEDDAKQIVRELLARLVSREFVSTSEAEAVNVLLSL